MSSSNESDVGFPRFEDQNFTSWLVQFNKTHLRKHGANVAFERSRPSDLKAQENSIPVNAQQHRVFNDDSAEYDR